MGPPCLDRFARGGVHRNLQLRSPYRSIGAQNRRPVSLSAGRLFQLIFVGRCPIFRTIAQQTLAFSIALARRGGQRAALQRRAIEPRRASRSFGADSRSLSGRWPVTVASVHSIRCLPSPQSPRRVTLRRHFLPWLPVLPWLPEPCGDQAQGEEDQEYSQGYLGAAGAIIEDEGANDRQGDDSHHPEDLSQTLHGHFAEV